MRNGIPPNQGKPIPCWMGVENKFPKKFMQSVTQKGQKKIHFPWKKFFYQTGPNS